MRQVTILSRQLLVSFPAPGQAEEVAQIVYSTPAFPPRLVNLPPANYRSPTPEEAKAAPRYEVLPKDKAAEDTERQSIAQDIARARAAPPTAFTLP